MVYELSDTAKAEPLFAGMRDTLITSCLQGIMGKIYVTDLEAPRSAFAFLGCFGFFAGAPDRELVKHKPEGFVILIPQNEAWAKLIEEVYPQGKRVSRYAIRKDTRFDPVQLRKNVEQLPEGYVLRSIDAELYDKCLESPLTADFVSVFSDREQFLRYGRGVVALKDGEIVSGASSYSRYREGIEIEVDTAPRERRKHLALACCSALILRCLEEGLYPSWDAQNPDSVRLAEKLGYAFDHEYAAYEVSLTFVKCDPDAPDARELLGELNAALTGIIGRDGTAHVCLDDFRREGGFFLVGYDGEKPVCCAGLRRFDAAVGEVKRVYARKNRVGAGAGLMAELERRAAEQGCGRLVLECREGNRHAIGFYLRCGYTPCAQYPPYVGEPDAVCMEKALGRE